LVFTHRQASLKEQDDALTEWAGMHHLSKKRLAITKQALAERRTVRLGRAVANSILNATGSGDVLTVYARKI